MPFDEEQQNENESEFAIPDGTYDGRGIEGSEQWGKSSNGGSQVSIDLDLGEHGVGTTILSFSGKAIKFSLGRLEALGWEPSDELESFPGISRNVVKVTVRREEYDGEIRQKIDIAVSTFAFKEAMSTEEKRAFMSEISDLARSRKRGGVLPTREPAQAGPNGYPQAFDETAPATAAAPAPQQRRALNLGGKK